MIFDEGTSEKLLFIEKSTSLKYSFNENWQRRIWLSKFIIAVYRASMMDDERLFWDFGTCLLFNEKSVLRELFT